MVVDQQTLDRLNAGFKRLQESNSKSLLRKYLTQGVFDQLKTRKTAMGASLLDVIQSGNFFSWFEFHFHSIFFYFLFHHHHHYKGLKILTVAVACTHRMLNHTKCLVHCLIQSLRIIMVASSPLIDIRQLILVISTVSSMLILKENMSSLLGFDVAVPSRAILLIHC